MSTARTLPATVAPRFAGASRAAVRTAESSFEVVVAEGFLLRLRGLARLDPAELVPLLIPHCRSIHTFGMRATIDVAWLDADGVVVRIESSLPPGRIVRAPRGHKGVAALELPAGDAAGLGLEPGLEVTLRF